MSTTRTRRRSAGAVVLTLATSLLVACSSGTSAEPEAEEPASPDTEQVEEEEAPDPAAEAAEFYDGETIKIIIPYNPGGGFDQFVRLLVPELEKELEGVSIQVENLPGGGGLVGANAIYQSEPDGLTFGLINYPGAVFAETTETEGVEFENSEWTFLARLGAINPIVYTGKDTGLTTFEDIMDSTEPVTFGIGGVGSDAYYATVIMSEVLGFPNQIIAGYPGGGEADAALLVGEVMAGVGSVDATLGRIEGTGTNIVALLSTEPNPKVADVPLITEFGDAEQQEVLTALATVYDLERTLVAPPGVPEERAQFLADAIYAAATAGAYEETMTAAGYTASPLPREDVLERAAVVQENVSLLAPYIQAAV
nr:tripartite tricarboxylate transporter substrate-binding protein [uncultured Actinotalea sp.]